MKKINPAGFSLATRMSISIGLLVAFLVCAVGYTAYARMQQVLDLVTREKGEAVACAVTALAAERLQAGDPQLLAKLMRDLKKSGDVAGAAVVSAGGKVVAHSDPAMAGQYVARDSGDGALFPAGPSAGPLIEAPVRTGDGSTLGYFYVQLDRSRAREYARELGILLGLMLAAAVLAGVMLAHVITKRLLRQPLGDLMEATRHIATGNFAHRVPVRKADELGRLAQAFNTMAAYLSSLFRTVYASTAEMARSSQLILAKAQGASGEEDLAEIKSAAKRLARVVERLHNLSRQFKT